jgi:hypothetical protein
MGMRLATKIVRVPLNFHRIFPTRDFTDTSMTLTNTKMGGTINVYQMTTLKKF